MPIAVIAFDFDPLLRLAEGLVVRWQTIALAVTIATALVITGLIARRDGLRAEDLLFIVVGTVPGAVIAGRLGYVLLHLDYYQSNPGNILDPGLGAMELALGVVGGLLTGSYVASLLGAPIGAWRHVVALPVLFVLGVGKFTMVLGGAGQGTPSTAAWATAFLGPGPWGSLAPALPSTPSQVFEGLATVVILIVLVLAMAAGAFGRRDGRALFVAIAAWAFARAVVATTWRDAPLVAGFNAGTVIALIVGLGSLAIAIAMSVRTTRTTPVDGPGPGPGDDLTTSIPMAAAAAIPAAPTVVAPPAAPTEPVSWPDPTSRPPF